MEEEQDKAQQAARKAMCDKMWEGVKTFSGLYDDVAMPTMPKPYTLADHVAAAQAFRDIMDEECTRKVCGVCSKYCPDKDVKEYNIHAIPNLHMLDVDVPSTPELPRNALTRFTWQGQSYCLQPYACHPSPDETSCTVDLCSACKTDLKGGRVPATSLVAFDTGADRCESWTEVFKAWHSK
jgi:ferredoxin